MKKLALLILALAAFVSLPLISQAKTEDRLYDFTDAYYKQNGVDPTKINGRRNGADNLSVFDAPFFSHQRNVRALLTLPAYNNSGSPIFWTVMGEVPINGFTNDRAGQKAKQIADSYIEYVFPAIGTDPVGLGNMRQSVILDTRNGYFSNDPLGLWLHVWVSFTDRALTTRDGRNTLNDLAKKNGVALDGTPIIKTMSDMDNLFSKGYIQKRLRNADGSEGSPYAICPVIKDPKDGGIAPDTFLAITRRPDGSVVEADFMNAYNSLKFTGDWPR